MEPEDLLENLPSEFAATVERLRQLILSIVPEATERAYPVWKGIGYRHPEAGYFCGIFPSRKWVALGFEFGVLLPDPKGLLEPGHSSSRRVRYLHFLRPEDVDPEVVRQFLTAAASLKTGQPGPSQRARKLSVRRAPRRRK